MRSPTGRAILAVSAVTLAAAVLIFTRLGHPGRKIFDEVYYASDGCWYAGIDYRQCGLDTDAEVSWVHPPLGKQIIALGIEAFGNRAFGWRAAAAAAGTATVALTGVLGFLLLGSALWAGVAGLLAATESLLFVQSRVAMLDIFLAMFVMLGFVLMVADRVRIDRRSTGEPEADEEASVEAPARAPGAERPEAMGGAWRRPRGWRPLRLASGAAFGAAVAVKWSGVLALAGALVLSIAWERTRRKEAGVDRPLLRGMQEEGAWLYLAFFVVPLVVYWLPWIPWLADRGFSFGEWLRHQGDMAGYHFELQTVGEDGEPIHPYMSRAYSWLFLARPVAYYWKGEPTCCEHIVGIGSPFLYWGALLVLPYLLLSWRGRRDWRAGAILVPVLFQFLPWLAVARPLFLFYMTPVSPFLALGMTYAARDLARWRLRGRRVAAIAAAALVILVGVGVFAFLYPVLTGAHLPYEAWAARMWFRGWV